MNLEKLRTSLAEDEGALVFSAENRFYFTGFESSDGYLLVKKDDAVFLTDSRYTEDAGYVIKECRVEDGGDYFGRIRDFFSGKRVLIEASSLSVGSLRELEEKTGLGFDSSDRLDGICREIRRSKTGGEVNAMLAAQRIAEKALDHVLGFIRPGLTEKQVALELDTYMLSHGAEALSFQTICVSGKNSSKPHGVPSDAPLEMNAFLTMDFGAVYGGRHSDMTRTVVLGKADDEMKTVYGVVRDAQAAGIEFLAPGKSCRDADAAARTVIEKAGYGKYFGHGTGHGVGAEIHEEPRLSPKSEAVLRAGDVVTVEPGIYLPGRFGVRIEDMLVITESGSIDLTTADRRLIEL
ncbi:MAG: aminopeptidase P family protein [Clostridia bacterium]|nr:aminopeptidase P family protein [Clostridia bacterium]